MARDLADIFLHDTLIPDIFLSEYLSKLQGPAVKVYLACLFFANQGGDCVAKDVRNHLGMKEEDFKASLCELASNRLLEMDMQFEKIHVVDVKRMALDHYYRRTTTSSMEASVERVKQNKERETLIKSVNDSYFAGLMGPTWYQTIDSWFESYDFEPTVVYQMFQDAAKRGTLHGPQYLNKVAEDYHKNGVKSFADLSRYKEGTKKVRLIGLEVGKKLNKNMSQYDFDLVQRWVIDFNYDFAVIEVALRNAVRLSDPNLHYFDRILESWFKAGIRTSKEAENVERNRKLAGKKTKSTKRSGFEPPMEEREYDDDFYDQFFLDALAAQQNGNDKISMEMKSQARTDRNK